MIQSGHGFVHRRMDGRMADRRTDDVKPVYPPFNFVEVGGIIKMILYGLCQVNHKIFVCYQNFCGLIIQVLLYNIHIHYRKVAWVLAAKLLSGEFHRT